MSIEWFRDLALCIFGLGVTAVIIFIGVLAFLLYRKLRPILDSLKAATETVESICSCVKEEISGPLAQVAAFIQGISQAVSLVSRFPRGEEGGRND